MRKSVLAFVVAAGVVAAAGVASAQSFYIGKQLNDCDGFADFNSGDLAGGGVVPGPTPVVEEGGMRFTVVNNNTFNGFWGYAYCNGDGSPSCYFNGGANDVMQITRIDGGDFNTVEFQAGDGWCKPNLHFWVRAFNNGGMVAEFDIDASWGDYIGITGGGYDELRVAGYYDAATRDLHDEFAYNAAAVDNVCFSGSAPGPSINVGGSCPGTVTVAYSNFTSNTQVGIVFASNTGNFVIPNGPCAGTQLGLGTQNLQLVNTFNSGGGSGQVQGQAGIGACGGFLQLVESGSCATSNVDQLP